MRLNVSFLCRGRNLNFAEAAPIKRYWRSGSILPANFSGSLAVCRARGCGIWTHLNALWVCWLVAWIGDSGLGGVRFCVAELLWSCGVFVSRSCGATQATQLVAEGRSGAGAWCGLCRVCGLGSGVMV